MARLLDRIDSPADLKKLSLDELPALCQELRDEIIQTCARNGGHLGSSLGAVEINVALHYVFDSPRDKIVWDVGHQAYAHKLLTGRRDRFRTIRLPGGLAGFPERARVRARRLRRRPRVHRGERGARHDRGDAARRRAGQGGRGPRRRRAHRRGRLRGAEPGRLPRPPAARRAERQRDVHLAERRRALGVVLEEVRLAHLQPLAPLGEGLPREAPEGRRGHRGHPPRHQRDEGARHARHPLRGARVPLRRPGGRPRRGGARRGARASSRASTRRSSSTRSRRRGRATSPPRATRRRAGTACRSSTSRPASPRRRRRRATPTCSPTRSARRWSGTRRSSRSPRRCSRGPGSSKAKQRFPERTYDVGIAEQHAVTFAAGLACEGVRPGRRHLLDVPPARVRPDHPRRRAPAPARHLRARPRRGRRRRRQDAPGRLRPRLPALRAEPRRDGAVGRERAPPHAPHRPRARRAGGVPVPARRRARRAARSRARRCSRSARAGSCARSPGKPDVCVVAIGSTVRPAVAAAEALAARGLAVSVVDARFAKPLDEELVVAEAAARRPAPHRRGGLPPGRLRVGRASRRSSGAGSSPRGSSCGGSGSRTGS